MKDVLTMDSSMILFFTHLSSEYGELICGKSSRGGDG